MIVANSDNLDHTWTEEMDKPEISNKEEVEKYCQYIIDDVWNGHLRPGERHRTLIGVNILDNSVKPSAVINEHDWEKTNLYTISDDSGMYDTYRCKKCGIKGKRYGMSNKITVCDPYNFPKYESCSGKMRKWWNPVTGCEE